MLKAAMTRSLDPYSDEWSRVAFLDRRRSPNETAQEFDNALRRLVVKASPTLNDQTQDLLARDQFVTHVASGDFHIILRAAKPQTLELAIQKATEMEIIRKLEQTGAMPDARVREVSENKNKMDARLEALVGVVEGLGQEVRTMQSSVQALHRTPKTIAPSFSLNNPWVSNADRGASSSNSLDRGCCEPASRHAHSLIPQH